HAKQLAGRPPRHREDQSHDRWNRDRHRRHRVRKVRSTMRNVIALALSFAIASAALAADVPRQRELAFKILSAKIEKFDPPQRNRRGKYEQALVLRLEVDRA